MTTAITTNGGAAGTLKLAPRRYSSRLLIITFITYYYRLKDDLGTII
jgi:hypothetical protein